MNQFAYTDTVTCLFTEAKKEIICTLFAALYDGGLETVLLIRIIGVIV